MAIYDSFGRLDRLVHDQPNHLIGKQNVVWFSDDVHFLKELSSLESSLDCQRITVGLLGKTLNLQLLIQALNLD